MAIHTDRIRLDRALARLLRSRVTVHPDGCHLYDPDCDRQINVSTYDRPGAEPRVSVLRAAFALANPSDCLIEDEMAVHTCGNTGDPGTLGCCVNPDHLVKGDKRMVIETARHTIKGIGKWQTSDSIKNYRKARNKKNKVAKASRRRNR